MNVAVLGAGGTIAPAIVRDLAESEEVTVLHLLDLDAERAAAVATAQGGDKASAGGIDARDAEQLAAALADDDLLVNAASYRTNLDAMRACLAAGCHYLDLGGLYHVTAKQLELGREFERTDLIAILGIGSSPGKTNLMARVAVDQLDGSVERLDVAASGRDPEPPPGFSVPYALRTILDELTMRPIAIRGGEPVELEPLAPGGTVDFGDPIGEADTIHTLHSEMLTFPASFGCSEASFRLSLEPGVVERVRELAGASEEEVEAAGREASPPSARTVAVHLVEAVGAEHAVRVRAVTEPASDWGLGGGITSTAAPAAAAARLLARGEVTARGALAPERCVEPEAMFSELERRWCRFEVTEKEAEEVTT